MKEIPLTNSPLVTIVDDEDYELLATKRWQLNTGGKGVKRNIRVGGVYFNILMHRVIMNAPAGLLVDHRNRNPLDNRKENLRLATRAQNGQNRAVDAVSSSQFKGVSWFKRLRSWQAYITVNGRQNHLGLFLLEEDAAIAYNNAARELFGEFARLNPVSSIRTSPPPTGSPS
jgi:hypothetical protein